MRLFRYCSYPIVPSVFIPCRTRSIPVGYSLRIDCDSPKVNGDDDDNDDNNGSGSDDDDDDDDGVDNGGGGGGSGDNDDEEDVVCTESTQA